MRKLTLEQAIEKARKIHGDKFDYSKACYFDSKTKIEIICPIHGSFWQSLNNHIFKKYGCNLCSPTLGAKLTQEQFIKKCKLRHNDQFDYSKTIFSGVKNKIIIICKDHGPFEQIAEKHFIYGCASCAGNKKKDTDLFIKEATIVHNGYYNYDLVKYINHHTPVNIICPQHGLFQQAPNNHLKGKSCIKCNVGNTSKIEHQWLDYLGLPNDLKHRNVSILVNNRRFIVDGYLPNSNIIFEFLGDFWHGNPSIFKSEHINNVNKKTFGELFQKTVEKIRYLRKNGYKVISIWEKDFLNEYNAINRGKPIKGTKNSRIFRKKL